MKLYSAISLAQVFLPVVSIFMPDSEETDLFKGTEVKIMYAFFALPLFQLFLSALVLFGVTQNLIQQKMKCNQTILTMVDNIHRLTLTDIS